MIFQISHITTHVRRYVDGTPMSEVTPGTFQYIHPPHHGHTKGTVVVMNDRLTSLSFHVSRPSDS